MSKKKEEIIPPLGERKKAIPANKYWEWRTSIEELCHQKTKFLLIEEQGKTLKALEEVSKMRSQVHAGLILKSKNKLEEAEVCYHKFIEDLEKELGFPVKGKMIDPYTYEVKEE